MAMHSPFPSCFLPIWLLAYFTLPVVLGVTSACLPAELLDATKALASNPRAGMSIRSSRPSNNTPPTLEFYLDLHQESEAPLAHQETCQISKMLFPTTFVDASDSSYIAKVSEPW